MWEAPKHLPHSFMDRPNHLHTRKWREEKKVSPKINWENGATVEIRTTLWSVQNVCVQMYELFLLEVILYIHIKPQESLHPTFTGFLFVLNVYLLTVYCLLLLLGSVVRQRLSYLRQPQPKWVHVFSVPSWVRQQHPLLVKKLNRKMRLPMLDLRLSPFSILLQHIF